MESKFLEAGHIKELYRKYEAELSSDIMTQIKAGRNGDHDGGISRVDGEFVYMFIRELGARNVIEFSPNQGYSTAFLYQALRTNTDDFTFATFDQVLYEGLRERVMGLDMPVELFLGDALERIPEYVEARGLQGKIDFCFIDSDHSYDFARRYCNELFPLFGENCSYFIHDMCYRPMDFENFCHYGAVNPFEIGGTAAAIGEAAYVNEYLVENVGKYYVFSTHRIFGDQHECSSKLPRNQQLIDVLTETIKGFSLPPSAGPLGGLPRPPMGMLVIPASLLKVS